MAEKSKNKKGLIDTLTGHIADFVTKNSGLAGNAAKVMGNRGKSIDAAVDAATNGTGPSQQKTKRWPWQNQ